MKRRMLTFNGKTQSFSAWARELGLTKNGFYYRLAQGWSDDVITGPRIRAAVGSKPARHPQAKRMQPWERLAAVEAYIAGEKLIAIAAEFGCSEANISQLARRRGIPPRHS